jgi:Ran GTPase-activating protein (RanGAP) involved in mRNA processing and transport
LLGLDLDKNALGEKGGMALAEALGKGATPQLQELYLGENALGEKGGVALAEALGKGAMLQLQTLDLAKNKLGEVGCVALAEALGKRATPQLQKLILDDNPLGQRGAVALAAAISTTGALELLEALDVERTRLTAAGRRLLDWVASEYLSGRLEIVHAQGKACHSGGCCVVS